MKRFRDSKTGAERLWIEPDEIEARTEAELVKAGLMPTVDGPAVDVELFVEQHLGAQFDQYASLPADVLGQTDFRVGASPIAINLRRKPGFEQQLPRSWLLLALGLRAEARQPLG